MALLQVKTSFNIDLQFETAPFHFRLLAWIADLIILYIYQLLMVTFIDRAFSIGKASEFGLAELILMIPLLSYHFLFELFCNGQSPGKMLFHIRVVSVNGQNATISQYLLRWLLRVVDFGMLWGLLFLVEGSNFLGILLLLGSMVSFVLFVSTPNNQRIGDLVAGTVIVKKRLPYRLSDTIFQELDLPGYQVRFPAVMRLSDKDINIIDNIVKQHHRSDMHHYVGRVADKVKNVLQLDTDMPDDIFLETLLRDYNYLSRQ